MKVLKRLFMMWLAGVIIVALGIGGIWAYKKFGSEEAVVRKKNEARSGSSAYSEMVYIDASNDYYHKSGCRELLQNEGFIYKNDAVQRGYKPCKKCKP